MIWILWGMWPLASATFYKIFIDVVTIKYWVIHNHEFPHMNIDNIPVKFPEFDIKTWTSPWIEESIFMIKDWIDRLSKIWTTIYWMPCNTFHLYTDELKKYIWNRGQFISMVDETVNQVKNDWYKNIWIIWTETTINLLLYEDKFDKSYSIYKLDDIWNKKIVIPSSRKFTLLN
jgi:aspartate/glutamate racemase